MAADNDRPGMCGLPEAIQYKQKPGYLPHEILERIRDTIRARKDNMFDDLMHVNPKIDNRDEAYRASYSPEKYAATNKDLASYAAVNCD